MASGQFKEVRFQKGSIPIIEGQEENDFFYIIKKGKVLQTTNTKPLEEQERQILEAGNFFGVIDCMAKRPYLHTIEILEDTLAIVVYRNQFEILIQNTSPIALKILRYFSQKLRQFDMVLTQLSLKSISTEDPKNLFDIAEYYESHTGKESHAAYAYLRYIKYCPGGDKVETAKKNFSKLYSAYKEKIKLEPDSQENFYYSFTPDQVIFLEHEPGNQLYIIQEGEVKISKIVNKQEVLLNILKAGDIFGEMAILENKPRNATAIASNKVRVMTVTRENFPALVSNHPQIATRIITLLSDRIWFLHRHITNTTIVDPETRLYDALYIHLLKSRVMIEPKREYKFDLGFEDLLKFTGLKNPTGYRILQNIISSKKIFEVSQGKIVCKDISMIEPLIQLVKHDRKTETNVN